MTRRLLEEQIAVVVVLERGEQNDARWHMPPMYVVLVVYQSGVTMCVLLVVYQSSRLCVLYS